MEDKFLEIFKSIKFNLINPNIFGKKNRISLERNSDYTNITIKFNIYNIIFDSYEELAEFVNIIKNFLVTLHTKCKNFSPDLFLNMFKNTLFEISNLNKAKLEGYFSQSLDPKKSPNIFKISNFCVSNHELFHQASSKVIEGISYCGFCTYSNFKYFGVGITEWYTHLLDERYFGEKESDAYFFEVGIIKILENIVGKDKMEKYYFRADCSSLITRLLNYEEYNNIIDFIKNVDFIHYIEENDLLWKRFDEFKQIINKIYEFLFNCFKNKVINYLNNNMESNKDIHNELIYLFNSINWVRTYNIPDNFSGKNFEFSTLDKNKFIHFVNDIEIFLNNDEIINKNK